jgi:hypothetical protein
MTDEGSLSVVVAINEHEDSDIVGKPVLRIYGKVNGHEWSLPTHNAMLLLTPEQKERLKKMIEKLLKNFIVQELGVI